MVYRSLGFRGFRVYRSLGFRGLLRWAVLWLMTSYL